MGRFTGTGLGVDFQPGLQDGFINNRGADMVHEVGVACPRCRTADVFANMLGDGQSQTRYPNCSHCGGDGWFFRDPKLVRGLATNIRQQKNIHDVGVAQPGDMQFSIGSSDSYSCDPGRRRVARGDKFTATWDQPLDDGQTIVRGAGTLGENVRITHRVSEDEDRLWYEPVQALWCEDEDGVQYTSGSDFELGPGRVIKWVGKSPAIGKRYVLKYTAYFEWLVWAPAMERVDRDNRDLGPLVFLRRRHIAFINESPYVMPDDRNSLLSRTAC